MSETSMIEADLISRIIAPGEGSLPPEAARSILSLEFREPDVARMHDLAEKNREGRLSEGEQDEMRVYMRVGNFLSILKSKARKSLQSTKVG